MVWRNSTAKINRDRSREAFSSLWLCNLGIPDRHVDRTRVRVRSTSQRARAVRYGAARRAGGPLPTCVVKMDFIPEDMRTPPLGLVALLGMPDLHPAVREHLRSELRPPLNCVVGRWRKLDPRLEST